jgi:hypothetical protein
LILPEIERQQAEGQQQLGIEQLEDFGGRSLLVASDRNFLMQALAGGRVVIRGGDGSNTAGVESPRARRSRSTFDAFILM